MKSLKCRCSHSVSSHDDGVCYGMVYLGENQWLQCYCDDLQVQVTSNPAVVLWRDRLRRKGK